MVVGRILFTFAILASAQWEAVDKALLDGLANQAYPGVSALVGSKDGILYSKAFGNYTYGVPPPYVPPNTDPTLSPPMTLETRYDLASVTKVVATTTVIAILYQDGYLGLDTLISDPSLLGPDFARNGKGSITVKNLLLHNSGFQPDPNPNWYEKAFGCPESSKEIPDQVFTCRNQIYQGILNEGLQYPTGTQYVYSDLSMMTLMFVSGKVIRDHNLVNPNDLLPSCMAAGDGIEASQCYYEAFVRNLFQRQLGMTNTGYIQTADAYGYCAPTVNDTSYEQGYHGPICIQGTVSDGNAYAMGGIGGHAGFFSTVLDLSRFFHAWMWGGIVQPSVYELFIKENNRTQSSRALGWDTNDSGSGYNCGDMSPLTFTHTGYTGPLVCGNPSGQYYTILLAHRVYPTNAAPSSSKMSTVRKAFNNAVVSVLGP